MGNIRSNIRLYTPRRQRRLVDIGAVRAHSAGLSNTWLVITSTVALVTAGMLTIGSARLFVFCIVFVYGIVSK